MIAKTPAAPVPELSAFPASQVPPIEMTFDMPADAGAEGVQLPDHLQTDARFIMEQTVQTDNDGPLAAEQALTVQPPEDLTNSEGAKSLSQEVLESMHIRDDLPYSLLLRTSAAFGPAYMQLSTAEQAVFDRQLVRDYAEAVSQFGEGALSAVGVFEPTFIRRDTEGQELPSFSAVASRLSSMMV